MVHAYCPLSTREAMIITESMCSDKTWKLLEYGQWSHTEDQRSTQPASEIREISAYTQSIYTYTYLNTQSKSYTKDGAGGVSCGVDGVREKVGIQRVRMEVVREPPTITPPHHDFV